MTDDDQHQKRKDISEAILKTVVFFNMFDFPLTLFELFYYLSIKTTLAEIEKAAEWLKNEKRLICVDGFYFLPDHYRIIRIRQARYVYMYRKIKRARKIACLFSFIPWVKMVAIGNVIGSNNLKESSDIDFFIITEANRTWITRLFCVGLTEILGLRPKEGNERDKICLSFYISTRAMDLSRFLPDKERPDMYFIYWLAGLTPIFNPGRTYQKLINNNKWLIRHLPNWQTRVISEERIITWKLGEFYRDIVDIFIGGLDSLLRNWQVKKMPMSLKKMLNKDIRVVVNKNIIKLHANDRRAFYQKKWEDKVEQILWTDWKE
ncbi:hypothetical protein K8R32_01450 [bacterium]|nr:hypothetical protein [bacterium]